MGGRGLRPYPGKQDCIILDHSGSYYEHGPLDQYFPWELNAEEKIQERMAEAKIGEPDPITCPKCKRIFQNRRDCPECGWTTKINPKSVDFQEGDLISIEDDGSIKGYEYTYEEKKNFFLELRWHNDEMGYKKGWAFMKYIAKFDEKPPWKWNGV